MNWLPQIFSWHRRFPFARMALYAVVFLALAGIGSQWAIGRKPPADTSGKGTVVSGLAFTNLLSKKDPPTLRFVAIGDCGSGMLNQKRVTARLLQQYEDQPYKLFLILGDIVYSHDSAANFYKDVQRWFVAPYKPLRDKGVKILPAIGNHDVLFDYSTKLIKAFGMPASYYDYTAGPVHFFVLDTNSFDTAQQTWLKTRLKASDATKTPWKVVYGHHPIYSSGVHGDNAHLIKALQPVLETYKVDMYLAGHDHDYERLKPINGVQYIISGGGGASLRPFKKLTAHSVVRHSELHLLVAQATPDHLEVKAINTQGKQIDKVVLSHPVKEKVAVNQ